MSQNSESSSYSSWNSSKRLQTQQQCKCGFDLPLKTSWSKDNPGRRYWCCPNYGKVGYCGVFKWFDDEICVRSKSIIPGLLRKCDRLEEEINEGKRMAKSNERKMKDEISALEKKYKFAKKFVVILIIVLFVVYNV